MLLDNKQVAIVGGGPAGLTLARLLQRKGVNVKVYERDANREVRVQGATLDLHAESGLKAIKAAGLMDVFKEKYRPGADKGRVVDIHANIIYDEHSHASGQDFDSEFFRPEIDRADLRDILLDSLKPDTVVWDSHLIAMTRNGDSWKLEFKNGTTIDTDIVIGADGASSKIRPFVTPVRSSYAGTIILQGNIPDAAITAPHMQQLLKGGKIYTHVDGRFLHVSAKGDGSIDFYISSVVPANWVQRSGVDFSDRNELLQWAKREFAGWDNVWFELFENVTLPLLIRPQYFVPLDQAWHAQSNITLLGDAAHIAPPSGNGVNLAMLDALELQECFTDGGFENLKAAIGAYEKQMLIRSAAEVEEALDGVAWMHTAVAMDRLVSMFTQNK